MSARTTSPLLYFSAYAALYIIWGSTYLAIRFTVETIPPFLSGSLRFFLAGGILLVWCLYREQERPTLRGFLAASKVAGIMLLGGYGGVVWAQQTVPSSMAALIISIEPLWFVIFEWLFFTSRKPSTAEALGVALGHFVLADPAATGLTKTAVACVTGCATAPTIAQLEGAGYVIPDLASGSDFVITVTATVTQSQGSVTNTAVATAPAGVKAVSYTHLTLPTIYSV